MAPDGLSEFNNFGPLHARSGGRTVYDSLSFVVCQSFDKGSEHHTVYRVQQGCGIGKNYSGALADWLFFRKVERHLLDPRELLGIKLYLRFRDDLLTVLTDLSFSPIYRETIIPLWESVKASVSISADTRQRSCRDRRKCRGSAHALHDRESAMQTKNKYRCKNYWANMATYVRRRQIRAGFGRFWAVFRPSLAPQK